MDKSILYDDRAQERMVKGVNKLADAVKITMGPKGRNAVFDQKYDIPLVTNDGVTIAKHVELKDAYEAQGANIIKASAIRTNEIAGDGTTAAIVLSRAIVQEGIKNIASGSNPVLLKKGIKKACDIAVKVIGDKSTPIKGFDILRHVATISGNDDKYVGKIVVDAFEAVGMSGIVIVEDSQQMNTVLKYTNGIKIEHGYLSESFITNKDKRIVEMENPYVLLVDKTIREFRDLLKVLEQVIEIKGCLLIISQDVEGEALHALATNALKGVVKVAALKAPGFGETRKRNLKALSLVLDATVVTGDAGIELKNCGLEVCGSTKEVVIEKDHAILQNPPGAAKEEVEAMIRQVRKQMSETVEEYEIEKLQTTMSILGGGLSLISVGGVTELEMFDRKYRIEDSINAVYGAIADGIVPGGGKALLLAIPEVDALIESLDEDEKIGAKILRKALEAPVRQIALNAGYDGSVVLNRILSNPQDSFGFDALRLEYRDLMEVGIIDPAKVIKTSLVHAVSASIMLLGSNVAVESF